MQKEPSAPVVALPDARTAPRVGCVGTVGGAHICGAVLPSTRHWSTPPPVRSRQSRIRLPLRARSTCGYSDLRLIAEHRSHIEVAQAQPERRSGNFESLWPVILLCVAVCEMSNPS